MKEQNFIYNLEKSFIKRGASVYEIVVEQWDTDYCDERVEIALEERFKYTYTLAELDELQKVYLFANEKLLSFS
ncbi:hypothetical protein [Lactococcus garvieae]|uniref:hypothetical protein n=1 Tax=Lactococcus garvieae TaxID=1363 RepID=UPI0038538F8C